MSEQDNSAASPSDVPAPIPNPTARAGRYYRNTRYILAIALFGYGLWNIHDGGIPHVYQGAWEVANAQARAHNFDKMPFSDMDLLFNQILGCALPPLSILLLLWGVRKSRGEFRLTGNTLTVPGHPPMQLEQIESVDKSKWERKGIAVVTYRAGNGRPAKFKLDDFVYERAGIDEIFRRIEESLAQPRQPKMPAIPAAGNVPPPPPPPRPRR